MMSGICSAANSSGTSGGMNCSQNFSASISVAEPKPITQGWAGIGVMIFSIAVTFALVRFQKYVISHTDSVAISADSLHYTGDLLINGSVIVSLLLAMFFQVQLADPLFAIAIAGYLVWNAWNILRDSLHLLMDREFPEEDRLRIKQICRMHPQVRNVHDLRTRSSGMQRFIQFHLEMDAELPLWKAHSIGDEVEKSILDAFPAAEVIIHHDPAGIKEEHPRFG